MDQFTLVCRSGLCVCCCYFVLSQQNVARPLEKGEPTEGIRPDDRSDDLARSFLLKTDNTLTSVEEKLQSVWAILFGGA